VTFRTRRSTQGIVPLALFAALWCAGAFISPLAAARQDARGGARPPASSLTRPTSAPKPTDANGFIQRWLLLEPIRVPGQLTTPAVRAAVEKDFPVAPTELPHDGETVNVGDELTVRVTGTSTVAAPGADMERLPLNVPAARFPALTLTETDDGVVPVDGLTSSQFPPTVVLGVMV